MPGDDQAGGGEQPGPEAVGEDPGERPDDQEAERQRDHVDARPQRGLAEAVAVLRQPDALQPDDQHELDAAAAEGAEQAGDVAGGERADPEQAQPEHRLLDLGLDPDEQDQHGDPAEDGGQHPRVGPAGGVPAVGEQRVHDAGQHRDQADREQGVAQPVDVGWDADAVVAQLEVGPDGAEQAERDRDEEDEPPVDRGEHAAQDQPDERAADGGDPVDAHRLAPLVPGKASVRIAVELANRHAPPTPWRTRMTMIHSAPATPVSKVTDSRIEKSVKTAKPRLYMRTRPYMSPTRPRLTTSTAVTSMNPMNIHRKYEVLEGASGLRSMPRKRAGSEISRIDWLIVTIKMPSVVFDRAIHL